MDGGFGSFSPDFNGVEVASSTGIDVEHAIEKMITLIATKRIGDFMIGEWGIGSRGESGVGMRVGGEKNFSPHSLCHLPSPPYPPYCNYGSRKT